MEPIGQVILLWTLNLSHPRWRRSHCSTRTGHTKSHATSVDPGSSPLMLSWRRWTSASTWIWRWCRRYCSPLHCIEMLLSVALQYTTLRYTVLEARWCLILSLSTAVLRSVSSFEWNVHLTILTILLHDNILRQMVDCFLPISYCDLSVSTSVVLVWNHWNVLTKIPCLEEFIV